MCGPAELGQVELEIKLGLELEIKPKFPCSEMGILLQIVALLVIPKVWSYYL